MFSPDSLKVNRPVLDLITVLDIAMFRENADMIRADHDRRGISHDSIDEIIRLDEEWRKAQYDTDQIRRERNSAAKGIAEAKKSGDISRAEEILSEVADLGERIAELGAMADECLRKRDELRMRVPNILHPDVPVGEDDQKNTLHSLHGSKSEFEFKARNHNELIEMNLSLIHI